MFVNGRDHAETSNGLRLTHQGVYVTLDTDLNEGVMNTEWFRDLLATRKLSQRGLAKLMDLDPAAVSLMLRGQRRMTNDEAHQISIILGVPITEVLRQAGIEVSDDVRLVKVTGYIDDNAVVTLFPKRTHDKVVGPADCPEGTYALQKRLPGGIKDGWMLFVSPSEDDPRAHLGQMCCMALENGEHLVGHLQRGYRTGTFNIIRTSNSQPLRTDANVVWASKILWVKPQ
jgi:transcriptional regulator with XRE-family HTH domain